MFFFCVGKQLLLLHVEFIKTKNKDRIWKQDVFQMTAWYDDLCYK